MFERNIGALSIMEQDKLKSAKVFIAGCGGLGGYIAEFCVRVGIGNMVICDYDYFESSNINRQRFATTKSIGMNKSVFTKIKLLDINKSLNITSITEKLNKYNIIDYAKGCDIIFDALDNIEGKLDLEYCGETLNIPVIHGGVEQYFGQISAVFPGDRTITKLYHNKTDGVSPSVLVTSVAVVASCQVNEGIKVLLNKATLQKKLLNIDLDDYSSKIFDI